MAGQETQKIIDQYPKIGELHSDNHAGIPDIWRWPYGGDVQEGIEDGYCPQEEADGVKINSRPPLRASNWPWVITAYALVVVPLVAAVAGIYVWAGQNIGRSQVIALSVPVTVFVAVPVILATWHWIKQESPPRKKA